MICNIEKELKKVEKTASRNLSTDFSSSLKVEIINIDSRLALISIAELQADNVFAKRITNGHVK